MPFSAHRPSGQRRSHVAGPTFLMIIAVALAVLGGTGWSMAVAAAEPLTVPVSNETPANFESSCFGAGGQPFEIHGSSGGVATSVCEFSDGSFNECNWGSGSCSYGNQGRVQPTPSGPMGDVSVDPDDLGGVLDEGPSQPAATEPPAEETAEPATEPATGEPDETVESATEPAAGESDETDDDTPPTQASATEAAGENDPAGGTGDTSGPGGNAADARTGQSASVQEPASLTIVAFTCEPGYDPFALDADPARDCSEVTDGVPFALTGDDTDMTRSAGDDGSGTATFKELDPGIYWLAGEPPSWGGIAFVHDCVSSVRSFDDAAFFPLAMVGPTGTLGLTLMPGETLECGWYEVAAG